MPERSGKGAVASPFVAQGLRDALRNAYVRPCDTTPADLLTLLDRLH